MLLDEGRDVDKPETPPALRSEQKVQGERRLSIIRIEVNVSVGQLPDVLLQKDHHRQARGLLALLDHLQNTVVGRGHADDARGRLTFFVRRFDAQRNSVAGNVTLLVRGD